MEVININWRPYIYLILILFTIIGSASATHNNNNIQENYEEYNNDPLISQENSSNFKEYNDKDCLNTSKHTKLVSSKDNSKLISSNNINNISNTNQAQYIVIKESEYYTSDSSIQNIITESNPGSTIEFIGSFYKNLNLNINKQLTIISNSNTIISTTTKLPVFNILNGGSGTTISGFTINTEGSFVNANDVSNINIKNNKISNSKTGITFYNVFNSKIQNNEFLNLKTTMDISKSGAITISKNNINTNRVGAIGIKLEDNTDSSTIKILDNQIIGPGTHINSIAIDVGKNVYNVLIKGNTIKNWCEGIYFRKSINNFEITNNTITHNIEGILLESGKINGFLFTKNTVTDNIDYGLVLGESVEGYTSKPVVENNFFTKNGMDMRSVGDTSFEIGRNFAKNLCHKFYMRNGFHIKFLKNGNKIIASVIGSENNRATDLPNFQGTVNIDGKDYTLQFKNGIAYLDLSGTGFGTGTSVGDGLGNSQLSIGDDSRSLGDWGYSVYSMSNSELENYLKEYFGYSNDNNKENSESNTNTSSNSHSGFGSSGSSNSGGNSYVSSNTGTPSSSSTSSSSSSSSDSSSSSASSSSQTSQTTNNPSTSSTNPSYSGGSNNPQESVSEDSVAKQLSVDEENFKVAGVGGLILLIVLVIGMYYREDFFEMVGNN